MGIQLRFLLEFQMFQSDQSDGDDLEALPPLRLKRLPDEMWVRRLTPEGSADLALEVIEQTAALVRRARDLRSLAEERAVAWIERNGDLVCGTVRYYAGHRTVTRCTDPQQAVEMLLEVVGGDMGAFAGLLASSAFRYGACRSLLAPEQYDRAFQSEQRIELCRGKPRKRLHRVDEQFLRLPFPGGAR